MRHGKKFNHLSRPAAHRKALLANLAKALILHKRINTTLAKAKALRQFIEPILTKVKNDTTHSRRVVFSYFQEKVPVKELFNNVAPKIANRPGGYTRIIRLGNRLGDNAEMCMIELVDYNELLQKESKPAKTKTRRSKTKAVDRKGEPQVPTNEKAVLASTPKASIQGSADEGELLQVVETSQLDTGEQEKSMPEVDNQGTTDVEKDD
jgi:large subunit ribosomal protein L17